MFGHGREIGGKHARQDLRHELHDAGVDAPHVGQGHADFQADEAAADDHGVPHLAGGAGFAHVARVFQGGDAEHIAEIPPFHRRHLGRGSGGDDQLVVGEILFRPALQIPDADRVRLPVDGQGFRPVAHGDPLAIPEEFRRAHRAVGGGAQGVQRIDFSRNVIGNAAPPEGNVGMAIKHGDFGGGIKTFEAARGFGSQSHGADDDDAFGHYGLLPARIARE